MLKLLKNKPKYTVEQIHEEFDTGEERILQECDKLLTELKIPTENKVIEKANKLENLGFTNSETVKQAEILKVKQQEIDSIANITKNQANTIRELKLHYPLDKFITVAELNRICSKYELIHAPVANYIKDVPEKNVLEMTNRKPLISAYNYEGVFTYQLEFQRYVPEKVRQFFNTLETKELFSNENVLRNFCPIKYEGSWLYTVKGFRYSKIDKSGLFIAAPKSYFDLSDLQKKTKFGFFKVEEFEVKDPVVFEYCINDVIRIITKWGTEDDQSYLDPGLVNEIQN